MVKLTANVMTEEHQGFIVLAFLFFFFFLQYNRVHEWFSFCSSDLSSFGSSWDSHKSVCQHRLGMMK